MPYTDDVARRIIDAAEEARSHAEALRPLVQRAQLAVIGAGDTAQRLIDASDHLGRWMSAAVDDPNVCEEMKTDIRAWFAALEDHRNVKRIAAVLPKAYAKIYEDMVSIRVKPTAKRKGQRNEKLRRKSKT